MSERYSRLFALSENQYANGSPVVIAAGALLKDNQTGKIVAQIKMRSIDARRIKAATVCVVPYDTVGNPIGDSVRYQYLDLNVARDEEFGQKVAIVLPNSSTRSFVVTVEEIVFATNTVWSATGEPWEVLPVPSSIGRVHGAELEKQFRLKYGANCKNIPLSEKDLWYCACGTWNRIEETECHTCRKSYAEMSSIDYDALHREKNIRVAAEKEQAEKEAAEAKAHAKKMGKIAAIIVPTLVVLIVVAVIISNSVKKSNAYEFALSLVESGQYEDAIEHFAALGDYKDSAEQIQFAENAIAAIENSVELKAAYENAVQLMKSNVSANENKAYNILLELGKYKNAEELLADFQYAIIAEEVIEGKSEYTLLYEYDCEGILTDKFYNNGGTVSSYTYDSSGRLVKEIGSLSWETTEYWYNENGTFKKTKQARSRTGDSVDYSVTQYNEHGYPIQITDECDNDVWNYQYCYAEDGTIDTVQISCRQIWNNNVDATIIIDMSEYNSQELYQNASLMYPVFLNVSDDGLNKTSYRLRHDSVGVITVTKKHSWVYDSNGNLVKEIWHYDDRPDVTTEYNAIYGYIYTPDAE